MRVRPCEVVDEDFIDGLVLAPELMRMRLKAQPLIEQFCEKYRVQHVATTRTEENGSSEPLYFFSSNDGGYSLAGIRASLEPEH